MRITQKERGIQTTSNLISLCTPKTIACDVFSNGIYYLVLVGNQQPQKLPKKHFLCCYYRTEQAISYCLSFLTEYNLLKLGLYITVFLHYFLLSQSYFCIFYSFSSSTVKQKTDLVELFFHSWY